MCFRNKSIKPEAAQAAVEIHVQAAQSASEAESKEKHGVWDPMPEMTITSPYVQSRVDSKTFTIGNPMPKSTLTLCQSRLYPPVRDFRFSLRTDTVRPEAAQAAVENIWTDSTDTFRFQRQHCMYNLHVGFSKIDLLTDHVFNRF